MTKRKNHSVDLNVRVALEEIRYKITLAERVRRMSLTETRLAPGRGLMLRTRGGRSPGLRVRQGR